MFGFLNPRLLSRSLKNMFLEIHAYWSDDFRKKTLKSSTFIGQTIRKNIFFNKSTFILFYFEKKKYSIKKIHDY